MGFFSDVVSWVGETFGIKELDWEGQKEEAIELAKEEYQKERARLTADLQSASSKARIRAERDLAILDKAHNKKLRTMVTERDLKTSQMDAEFKAKQKDLASQADLASQTKVGDKDFDRKKMLGLRDRAIRMPTVGPRPGQGTVIPRPSSTSPRSGQDMGRRPR